MGIAPFWRLLCSAQMKHSRKQHGGDLSIHRRKSKRLLSVKNPFHVTLRSDFAKGKRSLLRHKNLIYTVLHKASKRFGVRIHEQAICGNHIHLLVRGRRKISIQNFFRVVAGHIAQKILEQYPILESERLKKQNAGNAPRLKYERKFWNTLLYSRWVAWGRDFSNVVNYIERNMLEALGMIPYVRRKWRYAGSIGAMHLMLDG